MSHVFWLCSKRNTVLSGNWHVFKQQIWSIFRSWNSSCGPNIYWDLSLTFISFVLLGSQSSFPINLCSKRSFCTLFVESFIDLQVLWLHKFLNFHEKKDLLRLIAKFIKISRKNNFNWWWILTRQFQVKELKDLTLKKLTKNFFCQCFMLSCRHPNTIENVC